MRKTGTGRAGNEADGGGAGSARKIECDEESGPLATAGGHPARNVPVEQIGALTANELEEVTLISDPATRGLSSGPFDENAGDAAFRVLRKPTALPPPLPQRAAAAEPARPALEAFYDTLPHPSERAEIRIEERSLDFTNPFVGSSLVPPPRKKRPWRKPASLTAAAGLLIGAGYAAALLNVRADVQPRHHQPLAIQAPILQPTAAAAAAQTGASPQPRAAAAKTQPAITAAVVSEQAQASVTRPEVARPQPAPSARVSQPLVSQPQSQRPAAVASAPRASVARPVSAIASSDAPAAAPAAPTEPTAVGDAPAPAAASLSRDQVKIGLESVRSALQTCAAGGHGQTMADVTISGAGRVSYALIEGAFAGTPQGSCMARALRAAQFPPFTSAHLRVRYPFVF